LDSSGPNSALLVMVRLGITYRTEWQRYVPSLPLEDKQ
jgi:hypothetical protein